MSRNKKKVIGIWNEFPSAVVESSLYKTLNNFLKREETSLMSFEGQNLLGRSKIMEKINSLTFQKIAHSITKVDCQPMFDGGVLVCVLGQLKTDDDPPHTFSQTFVLKPYNEGFYVQHDVFRIAVHDAA
ncbi:putative nuclear transport factor 2 isoform X3 [Tachypleus tridentatus]|uniref:putative nuclear transport factor 2 isoform X3 n=1 Tax=Tachypleus tridentatus TaxID=6853 RepID=UPI003FD60600